MDEGRGLSIVYPDFSKAFDTVSYNILINKVWSIGLVSEQRGGRKTGLKGLWEAVWRPVNGSVPQGSLRGWYCLNIFINDLVDGRDRTLNKSISCFQPGGMHQVTLWYAIWLCCHPEEPQQAEVMVQWEPHEVKKKGNAKLCIWGRIMSGSAVHWGLMCCKAVQKKALYVSVNIRFEICQQYALAPMKISDLLGYKNCC